MLSVLGSQPTQSPVHDSASVLRRQLHLTPAPLQPGMLPLQRDVRWILDVVLEKLAALKGNPHEQASLAALHQKLANSEQRLEIAAEELPDCYAFFKKAEHLLGRHRRQNPDIEADYTLCRALKWQFRAAVSEGAHVGLTQRLLPSLAFIRDGGERINHRHIGYTCALDAARQICAGPYVAADSHVEITPDQRVKSTRVLSVQGRLKSTLADLSGGNTHNQLGLGYVSSREYTSLEHFADARSGSVRTSLSASILRTARHLPTIVSDHHNLSRHRAYAALSQPYVRDALTNSGLGDLELPSPQNTPPPVMNAKGIALNARNKVAINVFSFLKVNTHLDLTLQRTRLRKALDILGLYDTAPAIARQQLATLKHTDDDPAELLQAMKNHVAHSSQQFTRHVSAPVLASVLNSSLHTQHQQACRLLERYVWLKAQSRIDPHQDIALRARIQQDRAQLRPEALKVFELTAKAKVLSGSTGFRVSSQVESGIGVTIEFSHRRCDDPHLSGDYLEIEIAPLKSTAVLNKLLRQALSSIGEQTFDWERLIAAISATLLDPARPSTTQVLVKIKHGQPVMLCTRHTVKKDRDLVLPELLKQYSGLDLQSLRTQRTLCKEQLGSASLDHLLPIARHYLNAPETRQDWDRYVQRHADGFQALLDTIGQQAHGTVLSTELDALKRISPALSLAVETLAQQAHLALEAPTPENRARAQEAFHCVLLEYLPHYEAKVSEAWTLS